jgi:hypothetical protein
MDERKVADALTAAARVLKGERLISEGTGTIEEVRAEVRAEVRGWIEATVREMTGRAMKADTQQAIERFGRFLIEHLP